MTQKAKITGRRVGKDRRLFGVQFQKVYNWDEPVGFEIEFGFGPFIAKYISKRK